MNIKNDASHIICRAALKKSLARVKDFRIKVARVK
jgi:hypothetical protein